MPNPRLATRYAKAILDLAVEKSQLEEVYKDMLFMQKLLKGNPDFLNMLRSPVVPSDKKNNVIELVTGKSIGETTAAFMKLLVNKGREADLPEVITAFIRQYKDKKGIHVVKLTSAVALSEEVKNSIVEQVKKTSNMKTIELEEKVDPSLIGGFVLQAGDQLIDASIAYDLKMISRQFDNNDFIYKVR